MIVVACVLLCFFCIGCETKVLDFSAPPDGVAGAPNEDPGAVERALIVETDLDLGRTNTFDRACPDGGDIVAYRVTGMAGTTLDLDHSPSRDCLAAGDEVVLINLQGTEEDFAAVGQHELLLLDGVEGSRVRLLTAPQLGYGSGPSGDLRDQRVMIQRVPRYLQVTVASGAELTAPSFKDGGTGILALRAVGDVAVHGSIHMNGAGYRGGPERDQALDSGLQGESVTGPGHPAQSPNLGGGGGGLGDQTDGGCVQDGNAGGGGGHLMDGQSAVVDDLCSGAGAGHGGQAYASAGKMFLGSGGGSGGVDNVRSDNPPGARGGAGGGIVWLIAQSVSGSGVVQSRGQDGAGDAKGVECASGASSIECYDHSGPGGGGAGGTVRLSTVEPFRGRVDVSGGAGGNGYDRAGGDGGSGALGVVQID